jgi:hypothetical protein
MSNYVALQAHIVSYHLFVHYIFRDQRTMIKINKMTSATRDMNPASATNCTTSISIGSCMKRYCRYNIHSPPIQAHYLSPNKSSLQVSRCIPRYPYCQTCCIGLSELWEVRSKHDRRNCSFISTSRGGCDAERLLVLACHSQRQQMMIGTR